MLVRIRKNFVVVARQVNNIRDIFLDIVKRNGVTFENQIPYGVDEPVPFKITSTYLMMIFLFSFINSIILSSGGFLLIIYFGATTFNILIYLLFILSLFFEILYSRYELKRELKY